MTGLPLYIRLARWYERARWDDFPSIGYTPEAAAALPSRRGLGWDSIHARQHHSNPDGITGPAAEYVNDSDYATDEDGYYKTPLRAALAAIGSRNETMGHFLRRLPGHAYDPLDTAASLGNPLVMANADAYALRALVTLHRRYIPRPYTRW
jgi:hypothetical protein